MNSGGAPSTPAQNGEVVSVSAQDIDSNFLPIIHDIVKTVEKDPQDSAAKNKESLEAGQKVQELNKKFESVRELVKKLPGVDFTKEEQQANLTALRKQLVLKRQLIQKYKEVGNSQAFFVLNNQQAAPTVNGMDTS